MRYRIIIEVLAGIFGVIAAVVSVIYEFPQTTALVFAISAVIIPVAIGIYEIYQSGKENEKLQTDIVSLNTLLEQNQLSYLLGKAHQDWFYQKSNFNMHVQGEKGLGVYVRILKHYLSSEQILHLKEEGKLEKVLKPQEDGAIDLEVESRYL